ncbi:MAG: sensor histidine kinase [Candidatus Paceibacteria bacterium]
MKDKNVKAKDKNQTSRKYPLWIGIFVLFIAVNVLVVSSQVLYNRTVDLLTENLRERILTISITTAANIEGEDLAQLRTESDWQKPEWRKVVTKLNNSKYSNDDVVFMYIFRKTAEDPTQMEFVADADSINPYANDTIDPRINVDVNRDGIIEPEGPDKLQWPGQPYPEAVDIPEAFAAYDGPLTSADLYSDEYGTVLTGYAPIKDAQGNIVAILATDIKADDFFEITTQTLRPFVIYIVFLGFVITALTLVIIFASRRHSRKIEKSKDDIEELAKGLEKANARLRELDKQKSEFVSVASHQLRSPLAAIRGYASMLVEGSFGKVDEKMREPLERIADSAKMMNESVEDFLSVSRIEGGNMKYELADFNLRDLAENITDDLRPEGFKKGLLLLFKSELTSQGLVHADKGKTQQILHNLINNSLKYTPKGTVTVFVHDDIRSKKIIVDIIDTGIGMSNDTIHSLFEKFSRAKNANTVNIKGTGLGLFVAREMARAMGGDVIAHSDGEGHGSRFEFFLPVIL